MRACRSGLLLGVAWIAALAPLRAAEDALPIIQKAFEAARANDALVRQYVFHERIEQRRFNRRGVEKKRGSETWDVTLYEGSDYRRLIARDDRPLDQGPRRIDAIGTVTAAAATAAAKTWIDPEDLLIVVVGDRAQIESELAALELGPVEVFDTSVLE